MEAEEYEGQGPCERVSEETVEDALKQMKAGKAAGPSGVTADLLKLCGGAG